MDLSRRVLLNMLGLATLQTHTKWAFAQSFEPYPLEHKKSSLAKGRYESFVGKSKKVDDRFQSVLARIDPARIVADVNHLAGFKTRYSLATHFKDSENWVHDQLLGAGYDASRVARQPFLMPSGITLNNVILQPAKEAKSFVLACAHYDSTAKTHEQSEQLAPGADDNGSGIAVLLEAARVLRNVKLKRGVMFVAFAGEEQGLIGSQACTSIAQQQNWPIDLVINLDMVGHVSPVKPSTFVVEYDQGNVSASNDAASKGFAFQIAQIVSDYAGLNVEHTNIWSSDYMPFEGAGYPCVGFYDEGGDEPFYHSINDTPGEVDRDRMLQTAKILVASILSICELVS